MLRETELERLKALSYVVRREIVEMIQCSGSAGHYGGSLSCTEILVCLYFYVLRHDPNNVLWEDRDRFILSKGHAAPALYAVLGECGYFPKGNFSLFKKMGAMLQGHPDMRTTPGIEMSTGALGQGLSVAVGIALAARLDQRDYRVFVLLGDGELDEGSVWEAAMAASHYRLHNITAIIDRNRLQISGSTEEVMRLEPLRSKWEAFGWWVTEIDGNDIEQIQNAFELAGQVADGPSLVIANTVKGKGIPSLENKKSSHSTFLTDQEAAELVSRFAKKE